MVGPFPKAVQIILNLFCDEIFPDPASPNRLYKRSEHRLGASARREYSRSLRDGRYHDLHAHFGFSIQVFPGVRDKRMSAEFPRRIQCERGSLCCFMS